MHRHPCARRHPGASTSHFDHASQLVAHRERQVGDHELVAIGPFIGMNVAAADANRLHPHQDLAAAWFAGLGDVLCVQAEFGPGLTECQHG